jgi:hypothetical protein
VGRPKLLVHRCFARRDAQRDRHIDDAFSAPDHVVLCSFGLDLTGERNGRQLGHALRAAGFPGPQVRHLIRASPLLCRTSKGRYRLRSL